jgi:hypothetical protein
LRICGEPPPFSKYTHYPSREGRRENPQQKTI